MYRHVTMILLMVCAVPAPAAVYEAATAEEANARAPALKPGDELAVRDGTYADWRLEVPAAGAEGRPIIIRPASPGGVLFRRKTAINLKADWIELRGFHFEQCGPDTVVLITGAAHCRVTDCRFDHCGNPRSTFGHIVEVGERAGDNRVDHCAWEGSKSMSLGLRIRSRETLGVRNRFDHNTFRDIFHLAWNGQEAIQLGQGAPDTGQLEAFTIVEYNLFDNASGDPELISNKSSRNIIRYNVAANCRAELVLRGGNDCLVEGNVLVRNLGGIRVHGSRHTIINNLCASSERTGISLPLGGGNHTQADDCLIANNTVVNCRRMGLAFSPYGSNAVLPKGNRILANLFAIFPPHRPPPSTPIVLPNACPDSPPTNFPRCPPAVCPAHAPTGIYKAWSRISLNLFLLSPVWGASVDFSTAPSTAELAFLIAPLIKNS